MAAQTAMNPYGTMGSAASAASAAYMTPVSSPTNTLVVTPGNYSFGDFVKVGLPFALVVMVVSVVMVPWVLPLR
jgi:di/tricarboxylate transporter